ncbi:hypothetical protein MMC22_001934 [Lobaria immixta]|nr:hypothetical protein [Lobaria immixta]
MSLSWATLPSSSMWDEVPQLSEKKINRLEQFGPLPAIQEISGRFETSRIDESEDDSSGEDEVIPSDKNLKGLNSSSSPLTSLDLTVYAQDPEDLGHILRVPKALRTLSYNRYATLWGLSLDCDEARQSDEEIHGPMVSFISFKSFKVFKIAVFFLETTDNGIECNSLIDIFPPSLETLHLARLHLSFESLLEALEHLSAQKSPSQIPALKKLILDETDSFDPMLNPIFGSRPVKLRAVLWRGAQETAMGRLGRVAAAQGVSIDVLDG